MGKRSIDYEKLEVIADGLKQGNEKAFDQLFHMTRDYLFYFLFSIVRNAETADDILQDTYFTVYEKIHQYKQNNFLAWIMTIAKNKAMNELRNNKVDYYDDSKSDYLFTGSSKQKELLLLNDMSKILSPEELEIVLLHIIGNYTHKQISHGLDVPIGTITWRYSEAIKKLKSKLEV